MSCTEPIGTPADLHRVALHELAGVGEARLDRVGVAARAEQDDRDEGDGSDNRTKCGHASDPADRSHLPRSPPARPVPRALLGACCSRSSRAILTERGDPKRKFPLRLRRSSVKPGLSENRGFIGLRLFRAGPAAGDARESLARAVVGGGRVARKIAPSRAAPAISLPHEARRYSLSGGSRSSISPQTWSKSFFARKPAIRPPMMLKGVKRRRDTDAGVSQRVPGAGFEPARPRRAGAFKTPASHQFRHPGTPQSYGPARSGAGWSIRRAPQPRMTQLRPLLRCPPGGPRSAYFLRGSFRTSTYSAAAGSRRALAPAAAAERREADRSSSAAATTAPSRRSSSATSRGCSPSAGTCSARRRTPRTCSRRSSPPPSTRSAPTTVRSTPGRGSTGSPATAA